MIGAQIKMAVEIHEAICRDHGSSDISLASFPRPDQLRNFTEAAPVKIAH